MASLNIRKDDTVEVLVGKKEGEGAVKGKRGKVIKVDVENGKVMVQGLNLVKRHTRPKNAQTPGGIMEKPRMIDVSNVALVCPSCNKTTRVNHKAVEEKDGKVKYVRCCHKCGAVIEIKAEKATKKKTTTKKTAKKSKADATVESTENVAK